MSTCILELPSSHKFFLGISLVNSVHPRNILVITNICPEVAIGVAIGEIFSCYRVCAGKMSDLGAVTVNMSLPSIIK